MSIHLPGHSAPAAGFEVPLEMLSACHLRITRQCRTLRRLLPHLAARGADDEAKTAAAALMRYFDTAAVHHHADEEADLFPALLEAVAGSDAVCIRELTAALAAEHRELEAAWSRLRAALERLLAGDRGALASAPVEAFIDLYTKHIEREDQELLPMAARLLSDDALDRIGRAMRLRRGIELDSDGGPDSSTDAGGGPP